MVNIKNAGNFLPQLGMAGQTFQKLDTVVQFMAYLCIFNTVYDVLKLL